MNNSSISNQDEMLGFLIGRARRTLANQINRYFAEAKIDLNIEQWIILKNLWKEDGQTQQLLAKNVYKDKASVTRTLDALTRKNYIVKVPDKTDKRNKLIYLTHKGSAMKNSTLPHIEKVHELATAQITDSDLAVCKKVLEKVYQNIIGEK